MDLLTVKHSYAGGDLIALLPGLQHIYQKTGHKWVIYQQIDFELFYYDGMIPATVNSEGKAVSMNRKHFEMLKPLLLSQEYIEDFREWKGEAVYIDIDKSRDSRTIPIPYSPLHYWSFFIAPELQCDLSKEWIHLWNTPYDYSDKIIVNRTERYQNPYFQYYFLKQYESKLVFSGTEKEKKVFCEKWDLDIPHIQVNDFLELARYMHRCKGFIGNQSLCWHIADAMGIDRVLEVCAVFPNTFPTTSNGYACVYQEALELYVHKMINK